MCFTSVRWGDKGMSSKKGGEEKWKAFGKVFSYFIPITITSKLLQTMATIVTSISVVTLNIKVDVSKIQSKKRIIINESSYSIVKPTSTISKNKGKGVEIYDEE